MKPTDHLYQLIKSLTKSEKRYFKLYSQLQKGDKQYLRIIDSLEKMKGNYDEEKLKQILVKKQINVEQFHVTKNYLYNLILKALRSYNDQKSISNKLKSLLAEAKILEQKGLYNQYEKKLKSAKSLSVKYEKHLVRLAVLDREILLALGQKNKGLEGRLKELYKEVKHTMSQAKIEVEYKELLHQIFVWYRTKNKVRDKGASSKLLKLQEDELLVDASKATTFQTKICFFFSHALINHLLGEDLSKANLYYQKVIEIWERYPFMQVENYKLYKIHLSNYLNSCHSIQKYKPFPEILEKIMELPAFTFDEQAEEFQNVAYLELLYQMNTLQYESAIALIPAIEKGLKKYAAKVNKARVFSFYFNITILYFANEEYAKASLWIQKILDEQKIDHRKDVQQLARIIQLIVHYELEHYDFLESLYRSTYRGLKKANELHPFEKLVLQLIKQLQKLESKQDRKSTLGSFLKGLKEIEQNAVQKKIMGLTEIEIWAASKINAKTFLETLKEKKTNAI